MHVSRQKSATMSLLYNNKIETDLNANFDLFTYRWR